MVLVFKSNQIFEIKELTKFCIKNIEDFITVKTGTDSVAAYVILSINM